MIRASATLLALRSGGAALLFGVNIVMARSYGAEAYGLFAYVMSIASLLSFLVCAGTDTYMKRQGAVLDAAVDGGGAVSLHRKLSALQLMIAVPASIGMVALLATSSNIPSLGLAITTGAACWLMLALAQQQLLSGWLIGVSKARSDTSITQAVQPVVLGACVLVAIPMAAGAPLGHAAGALLVSQALAVTTTLVLMALVLSRSRRTGPASPDDGAADTTEASDRLDKAALLRLCVPFALLSATAIIERNIDAIMIGMMRTVTETGVYYACTRISALFLLAMFALNAVTSPMVVRAHRRGDRARLQQISVKVATLSSIVAGVLLTAILVGGERLLSLFDLDHETGFAALVILAGGNFLRSLLGPVVMIATMSGLEKSAARVNTASLVVNVALNALLIPSFGVVGAAFTTSLTRVGRSVVMSRLIGRQLGVRTGVIATSKETRGVVR